MRTWRQFYTAACLVVWAHPCSADELITKGQPKAAEKSGKDLYGDPLPEGAVARLGSVRLRHAGLSEFVFLDGGNTILSSGSDRVLRFWDVVTGKQVRAVRLQGTAGPGRCVTLSPDGKTLAAEDSGRLVFWEVDSGKQLKTLPAPKASLGYLCFSPNGKILAVGRGDWRVSFWDWETGIEREFSLPFHPRPVVQFHMDSTFHGSFSPDGKWFVAGASSLEPLGVFEATTGREVHRLARFARTSIVSPDNKFLAVCSWKNDRDGRETVIRLFELASGKEVAQFPFGTEDPYYSLAFSPDGKILACGFSDRSCLLDLTNGRVLHRLSGRPFAVAFSANGKTLVASAGHRIRFWDVATGRERHNRPGEFGYSPVLAVSPNGRLLASGDWMEQTVSLWDTRDGRLLRHLPLKGEGRYVRNLAFSTNGETLVASQGMGFLQFYDVTTGKERRSVQLRDPAAAKNDSAYFYQLHVSPDGKHVSTLERVFDPGEFTRLAFWETATGKPVSQKLFPGELRRGAWSADGKAVALPLNDGLALVELPGVARFHIAGASPSGPLAVSPDDRLLAARGTHRSSAVAIWEAATGKEVTTVGIGRLEHLVLAPDNRSLITTDEGFLRVWDLATGKERHRWPLSVAGTDSWGKTFVLGLLLAPDGRRVFTALADGTALVWDLGPALRPFEPPVKQVGEKELALWWADLASEDAGRAYAAAWRMAQAPEVAALGFLRKHLRPAVDTNFREVRRLIGDLDSDMFAVRQKAFKKLEDMGTDALPALRAVLQENPPLEVRRRLETLLSRPQGLISSPETLRRLRVIQVVEQIASKEAWRLLTEMARGAAPAAETQEARKSLERLSRRSAAR